MACTARSIGSVASGRQARRATFSVSRISSESAAPLSLSHRLSVPHMATTVMRFSVSVPVLSVHRTVVAPSVSIAAARRVKTRAWEMRHAPLAMKTAMTNGNSSGSRDMPKAMPPSMACSHEPRSRPNNRTVSPPATAPTMAKSRINQRICRCRYLQRQMRWLIRDFAIVGAVAGGLTVLLFGLLRGSWLQAMLGGIALGMSLLPEEFPLVMAVFMAMGAWRISQARVLTRRASAIETLGATTVLCTDKTGTLTENRMTVVSIGGTDGRWDSDSGAPLSAQAGEILDHALLACPPDPTDPMDIAVHTIAAARNDPRADGIPDRTLIRAYGLRPDLLAVALSLIHISEP